MQSPVILLSVMNSTLRQSVKQGLSERGTTVLEKPDKTGLLLWIRSQRPDLLLLETNSSEGRADLELVTRIRQTDRRFRVILIADRGAEALAVAALRAGVKDYFAPPFPVPEIIDAVCRSLADRPLNFVPRSSLHSFHCNDPPMIGASCSIRKIRALLLKTALVDSPVLITGETGTGKEIAAHTIHRQSPRHTKPLIFINCAAVPDGLLESELFGYEKGAFTGANHSYPGKLKLADGGTVVFDEIGDMSAYAQAKILRVLESKEVCPLGGKLSIPLDIRVLAATNRDLERLVAVSQFRKDLFYRLNVARIHLPPLRERKDDIQDLIEHFLVELNAQRGRKVLGFTHDARELLLHHDWPGNIRELRNLLEAVFIDPPSQRITIGDLPEWFYSGSTADNETVIERESLLTALAANQWNKSKSAKQLKCSRMTLYRKMVKYEIREQGIGHPGHGD